MILEQGKAYWTIMRRYHANRKNPMMPGAAKRDLRKLMEEGVNSSVRRRIERFNAEIPGGSPEPTGPRIA